MVAESKASTLCSVGSIHYSSSDLLVVSLSRDADHSNDTVPVDAWLHAIEVVYSSDQ
ncbi:MAG: hypothetical protein ACRDJP_04595 [Actinomycetota bacterium]